MAPRGPEPRRLLVDVTLTLEVGVTYDPRGFVEITDVDPIWDKLRIALAYWQPSERRTNIGVDHDVRQHLEQQLPRRLDVRLTPKKQ